MKLQYLLICAVLIPLARPVAALPEDMTPASSTHHVQGIVQDADFQPLAGALVRLNPNGPHTISDTAGVFRLSSVSPGRYRLVVTAPGFLPFESRPFDLTDDFEGFEAILPPVPTDAIVVTATQTPKLYAEVPVKTEVIGRAAIERKDATDVAGAIGQTPGVRVENNCQNCNFTSIRINGMDGKHTQVLIDSSPIFSALTAVYGLEQLPVDMVERIEIVKGAGSALYGGNAVAGVLNVLTREPNRNRFAFRSRQEWVQGIPGTNLGFQADYAPRGDEGTRAFLFGNHRRRSPIDVNGDGFTELGSMNNRSIGATIFRKFERVAGDFRLGVFHIHEDRRGGDQFDRPPHEADIAEWARTNQLFLDARWSQALSEKSHYTLTMSLMDTNRSTYYGSGQDPNAYGKTNNPLLVAHAQYNRQFSRHLLSIGGNWKRDRIRDEALGYGRVLDETYNEMGLFIQDDFALTRRLSVLSGVRVDRHSAIDRFILSPRASLIYKLTDNLGLRLSLASGFRPPQVFDEDLHITQVGGEGMLVRNADDLTEERSLSGFAGLDYGRWFGGRQVQFSVEGFHTRLRDTFVLEEVENQAHARVFERVNASGARVAGVTANGGIAWVEGFNFTTGWTFQLSRLDDPEPDFGSRRFFRTPNRYGFFRAGFIRPGRLPEAELSLDYTGPMQVPHFAGYIPEDRLETSPSFWVCNLRFSKSFPLARDSASLELVFGLSNLFNAYQSDLDSGPERDSGYVVGPGRPRSAYVGLNLIF